MIIESVHTTPIRIPLTCFFYNSANAGTKREWDGRLSRVTPKRPSPILEYVLVHIETDEGISGLGEAPADIGFFGQTMEAIQVAIDDYLGPQLVGREPFDIPALMDRIDYRENSCAKSGIDLALHDLVGKIRGQSVSDLLGGARRTRIPVAIEIAGGSPDDMAAACVTYMQKNVKAFKPKIGSIPAKDADRLRAIRDAVGPDISIRADANRGYSPAEAIELCRLAEQYEVGLELLEQPCEAWDLPGMAEVRRAVNIPIEADQSCFGPHDAEAVVRAGAADVLNIKIGKAGGLANAMQIAAIAEDAGLECVLGTGFGTGVKIAAKLQLAAAIKDFTGAVEFTELGLHGPLLQGEQDALLSLPLDQDGCLPVPEGPGLGVELDEAKVSAVTRPTQA
ncbi:MAG: enolase C-terminal domain-like protein [Kiritimatiellia bacterium]|jgi:L-alanine-DL-glutamate epimerase-like enolase superfamily enzyme|nr:enolase C-terminal domain-like protein [Kiritimatiellia bacterium]MDP6810940.1 enolase C-terminal domain-like protein [Kiritimatiellia bacterium]MDP7023245.1 enolase C-terminal domain-like protein [Kiritimatiellia bacterium]